jgi:hypothetical protein
VNHKVFIKCLENAFGTYRPGMRVLVEDWAASLPGDYLDRLMQEISRTHDASYPPTLARLIKEATSIQERTRYPALAEPPVTDAERVQVKAWLAGLLADLAKAKEGKVKK